MLKALQDRETGKVNAYASKVKLLRLHLASQTQLLESYLNDNPLLTEPEVQLHPVPTGALWMRRHQALDN